MRNMNCVPNVPIKLCDVANNADVRNIHAQIEQKERKKMSKLLEDCPEWFTVIRDQDGENSSTILVSLTSGAPPSGSFNNKTQQPQAPQVNNQAAKLPIKGAGKGGKAGKW